MRSFSDRLRRRQRRRQFRLKTRLIKKEVEKQRRSDPWLNDYEQYLESERKYTESVATASMIDFIDRSEKIRKQEEESYALIERKRIAGVYSDVEAERRHSNVKTAADSLIAELEIRVPDEIESMSLDAFVAKKEKEEGAQTRLRRMMSRSTASAEVYSLYNLYEKEMQVVLHNSTSRVMVNVGYKQKSKSCYFVRVFDVKIEAIVTDDFSVIKNWILDTEKCLRGPISGRKKHVIAIDALSYMGRGVNVLVLLHGERCLLFLLKDAGLPLLLIRFLNNDKCVFVEGHGEDIEAKFVSIMKKHKKPMPRGLKQVVKIGESSAIIQKCGEDGTGSVSLEKAVEQMLGCEMRGLSMTWLQWDPKNMTLDQIAATAVNSFYVRKLGVEIMM